MAPTLCEVALLHHRYHATFALRGLGDDGVDSDVPECDAGIVTSLVEKLTRVFGARPSTKAPDPDGPVELTEWVGEFEAGTTIARLSTFGINAFWHVTSATSVYRGPEVRGSVMVRFEDFARATQILADVDSHGDEFT